MLNCKTSARTAAKTRFKSPLLLRQATIATILMLAAVFFSSCLDETEKNNMPNNRAYTISKSDDNNWTTSGLIYCDSFTMISNNEVAFFVDGRKSIMKGQIIKCFSNKK